jgi:hypothetical protein
MLGQIRMLEEPRWLAMGGRGAKAMDQTRPEGVIGRQFCFAVEVDLKSERSRDVVQGSSAL